MLSTPPLLRKIAQDPYKCENLQKGWTPLEPIDFTVNGKEGMRLADAMSRRFCGLDGRDDYMFGNGGLGTSVSCRIHVRGFYDSHFHYH